MLRWLALALTMTASFAWSHDLPATPKTATALIDCNDHERLVVAVVFTYKDGTAITVDPHNMHGFKDAFDLWVYAGTADQQAHYDTDACRDPEDTTERM